jgi:single-strand DNA-binding protein
VKVRDWTTDDRSGTSIEVEAESLGHDLFWGVTQYQKVPRGAMDGESAAEEDQE